MEQTGHLQYEKKKGKTHFKSRPVKFLITQHNDIRMLKKNQAKQSLQNDKKTVYMFSNIFVLYYIQLSLLKMEYRWLLYCRTEEKKKANCSMSPAGLWHDLQRLSLLWSERKMVDWCCLKGDLPCELLFFSSSLGARLPSRTHWQLQPLHHIMCRFRKNSSHKWGTFIKLSLDIGH